MDFIDIIGQAGFEVIASLLLGVISILISPFFRKVYRRFFKLSRRKSVSEESFSEKLSNLTRNLNDSSLEIDNVINEISIVAIERGKTINKLQEELQKLENKEEEVKNRLQDLKDVPIPVAEHFSEIIESRDKKSALRDYLLFVAGVVVSALVTILLKI